MKYSLHLRGCSHKYLQKADEILVEFRDRKAIPDYAKKYPGACIALEVPTDTPWEIDEIKEYSILCKGKFVLCVPDLRDPRLMDLKASDIPFFWGYTITTFWELKAAIHVGVSQVRIGAPIFFEVDKLKRFQVTKRIAANIAHEGYIPTTDGIAGSWIRPEDVETYSDVFDIIEFAGCDGSKEDALYRIYAEQHEWPGRVDMLISNIRTDAYNRMIPEEFAQTRRYCGQRCAAGGHCRICHRLLYLADPKVIQPYKDYLDEKRKERTEGTEGLNPTAAMKVGKILQSRD